MYSYVLVLAFYTAVQPRRASRERKARRKHAAPTRESSRTTECSMRGAPCESTVGVTSTFVPAVVVCPLHAPARLSATRQQGQ